MVDKRKVELGAACAVESPKKTRCNSIETGATTDVVDIASTVVVLTVPSKLVDISRSSEYTPMSDDVFHNTSLAFSDTHYIHSLNIPGKYEAFDVYGRNDKEGIVSGVYFGKKLCGHEGIVHGGCISTILDELFGWTMFWMTNQVGFTANLSVNFRKPLPVDTFGIITSELDRRERRKVFMKARLEDNDGNLYAEATALFILPKSDTA
ncbi:Aste57867_13705 [Aphanomyces stellatus]|uniref:Acyl-coenzyme A thioesterase THEM4 n=1 Tax=Aphanomyces stellatus TaxID=120398 RepID=A0A485L0Z4_9STRA|nr:hypothetical protein As57867_013655 [Aphanomyces stellatus]VFT90538.1 Aste57867_13705 [Aphanomyces stellatus]